MLLESDQSHVWQHRQDGLHELDGVHLLAAVHAACAHLLVFRSCEFVVHCSQRRVAVLFGLSDILEQQLQQESQTVDAESLATLCNDGLRSRCERLRFRQSLLSLFVGIQQTQRQSQEGEHTSLKRTEERAKMQQMTDTHTHTHGHGDNKSEIRSLVARLLARSLLSIRCVAYSIPGSVSDFFFDFFLLPLLADDASSRARRLLSRLAASSSTR